MREKLVAWGSWAGLGLLLMLLRPSLETTDLPQYEVGQVADRTIIAPFPFQVTKSKADLDRERSIAAAQEPLVFRRIPEVTKTALDRLASVERDSLKTSGGLNLSESTLQLLSSQAARAEVFAAARDLVEALLAGAIVAGAPSLSPAGAVLVVLPDSAERLLPVDSLITMERALALLSTRARSRFPDRELMARATYELASSALVPTVVPDPFATELRRARAMERVPQVTGTILAGEVVVEAHHRVTEADVQELRSLQEAYAARASGLEVTSRVGPLVGQLLWTVFFLVILAASLRCLSPGILQSPQDTALLLVLLAILAVTGYAVRSWLRLPPAAMPISATAILATVFFDARVGFGVTMLGLLLSASYARFDVSGLVAPLAGALAAVFWIRRLRKRRDFLVAALWISLAASGAGLAMGLIGGASLSTLLRGILVSSGNAVASLFIVVAAFPVLETIFHRTTDLRLLELLDMNHVLMRQLALEAPGTYHHSIVVGNLAEAACDAIGANGLLARVGAYYHDIGKITKPQYFSENLVTGDNPHDRLTPKMSALVIASHVKEGLRLAAREGLPPAIGDFIAQHHGTMQISFFYQKMRALNPDARIDPEDFSYGGPKPRTRETAVVMLADAAEGASRALEDPTAARIRHVVQRVIEERLATGQLDECNLTFRDLEKIKEAFVSILVGVFHHRVKYPSKAPSLGEDGHGKD